MLKALTASLLLITTSSHAIEPKSPNEEMLNLILNSDQYVNLKLTTQSLDLIADTCDEETHVKQKQLLLKGEQAWSDFKTKFNRMAHQILASSKLNAEAQQAVKNHLDGY